jgi:hypothetical protein
MWGVQLACKEYIMMDEACQDKNAGYAEIFKRKTAENSKTSKLCQNPAVSHAEDLLGDLG